MTSTLGRRCFSWSARAAGPEKARRESLGDLRRLQLLQELVARVRERAVRLRTLLTVLLERNASPHARPTQRHRALVPGFARQAGVDLALSGHVENRATVALTFDRASVRRTGRWPDRLTVATQRFSVAVVTHQARPVWALLGLAIHDGSIDLGCGVSHLQLDHARAAAGRDERDQQAGEPEPASDGSARGHREGPSRSRRADGACGAAGKSSRNFLRHSTPSRWRPDSSSTRQRRKRAGSRKD